MKRSTEEDKDVVNPKKKLKNEKKKKVIRLLMEKMI